MEGYTCEVVFVTESASPPPGFTKTVMPSGAVIYSKKSLAAEIAEIVVVEVAIAATGSVVLEGMVAPRLAMLAERVKTEFALLRRAGTIARQQKVQEKFVVRVITNAKCSAKSAQTANIQTVDSTLTNAAKGGAKKSFSPEDFADEVARIRSESAARHGMTKASERVYNMAVHRDINAGLNKLSAKLGIERGELSKRFHNIKRRGGSPHPTDINYIDDLSGDVYDFNMDWIGNVLQP
jgi:hypothetical protein